MEREMEGEEGCKVFRGGAVVGRGEYLYLEEVLWRAIDLLERLLACIR
jgi:hypothetical protein